MSNDHDPSVGDQHTRLGQKSPAPADISLGDRSTFGDASSISDLAGPGSGTDLGMEVVDLTSRYRLEGALGKGGMGEVTLATDTRLNRKVAIKRILGDTANNKKAVDRFLTEAKSIAALNHPNVVQIHDFGRTSEGPFLIMEHVDGGSLLDRCRSGVIPLEEAVEIICQVCDGLAKAHEAGIIHRDIKPANILLTRDGVPKLTDFGLAKAESEDHGMTATGAVLGTLDFMPPEQRRDANQVDARSDLWSLAATLYQMVTGESPKVIRIRKVPSQLQDLLDKGLEESKENRFQTAREFREAIRSCLEGKSPPPVIPVPLADPDELAEGTCPTCRAQNDLQRKFCKKCAGPLQASCFQCRREVPAWDQVCGNCGGRQQVLAEAERQKINAKRQEAETLASQMIFEPALRLAHEIASITDERLKHQNDWAEAFIKETEMEHSRQLANAAMRLEEARKHRQVFDYSAAIRTIQSIPGPIQNDEMKLFDAAVKKDRDELQSLLAIIRERIKQKEIEGLLELVIQALELDGNRQDLQKIRLQLLEREEKFKQKPLRKPPLVNSIGMEFKLLPSGKFRMGNGNGSGLHQVKLTKPFYLGVTQVTQAQFKRVMGKNPSHFKGPQNPVENVFWQDAVDFCKNLSRLAAEKAAGRVYRLPTEAEWEYACRAGTTTLYSFGDDEINFDNYGWFEENSSKSTHPVALKEPNQWGFYDMHGNVWEWCADWWCDDYDNQATTDPVGPKIGLRRVARGGCWHYERSFCNSGYRNWFDPKSKYYTLGFRVAMNISENPR